MFAGAGRPVRGSGFYRLQYSWSRTAPVVSDLRPSLAGLPTPALILKGSCDYLPGIRLGYHLALPHGSLIHLPGAGHNLHQDRQADALAAIRAFLTGRPIPTAPYPGPAVPARLQGPP